MPSKSFKYIKSGVDLIRAEKSIKYMIGYCDGYSERSNIKLAEFSYNAKKNIIETIRIRRNNDK